ncbi:MAG TPA: sugar ABC transporter ATP-binding protein [Galbitalea sp.]|jgi:simple sugar transport system ATP-binding protein/ribose transport system ATP-binding protein
MPASISSDPHVHLTDISKSFGGVRVLSDVNLTIARGTVHGLVGENGAGKSSLSKIIAGLLTADSGQVQVNGETVTFRSPREALGHGIATIAQELALVPGLSVAENVFLGAEPRRAGFIQRRVLRARFTVLASEAGFDLRADARAGSLRTADQQKVEILRALSRGADFIIMDEPTAALSREDAQRLHEVVRSLAASGKTVLLISHFLSEVLSLADTVTILRDGKIVRTAASTDETEGSLIEGMLGRALTSVFPQKTPPPADAAAVLSVKDLTAPGVDGTSFEIAAGEIVGLAGLVGAGRSELAHAIFGGSRRTAGSILVDGRELTGRSPSHALRHGIFLIPESRKEQGLLLLRPIRENVTLASLRLFSRGSWIRSRPEHGETRRVLGEVTVRGESIARPVASLSGGNQQKVMFARGMLHRPRVLIADEPTRGVDVGSRRAIYDVLVENARQGVGVLVISSDIEEVLGLAHRVLVIRHGRVVAELAGSLMTEENILTAAFAEQPETGQLHEVER